MVTAAGNTFGFSSQFNNDFSICRSKNGDAILFTIWLRIIEGWHFPDGNSGKFFFPKGIFFSETGQPEKRIGKMNEDVLRNYEFSLLTQNIFTTARMGS